jgi:hypothetical protein
MGKSVQEGVGCDDQYVNKAEQYGRQQNADALCNCRREDLQLKKIYAHASKKADR